MDVQSTALKTLEQLICGFDVTQLLSFSDIYSSSTVSQKIRLLHPEGQVPCSSFSDSVVAIVRKRAVDQFSESSQLSGEEGWGSSYHSNLDNQHQ